MSIARFIAMTRAAKEILATSDAEWEKIAALTGARRCTRPCAPTAIATGRAFRAVSIADEEADARVLYRVLATVGGRELVGPAPELESGTFYHAIPGD